MTAAVEVLNPVRTITIDALGAGRHAQFAAGLFARLFEQTALTKFKTNHIDPAPGKAEQLVRDAQAKGMDATAYEMTGQEAIARAGASKDLLVIMIDHAPSCAECLVLAAEHGRPVVITVFIQWPSGKLMALRGTFAADDRAGKLALAAFFVALGRVTVRAGSSKIWGAEAPPANILLEEPMRRWFFEAMERARAMAAGVPAEGANVEVSFNGDETIPLFIRDSRAGFADHATLIEELTAGTATPLDRGTSFVIAEVADAALHVVSGRKRALDQKIAIDGGELVDAEAYAAAEERRVAAERAQLEAAMRQAERSTWTSNNPVYVTD
jgi:hypothetical protein